MNFLIESHDLAWEWLTSKTSEIWFGETDLAIYWINHQFFAVDIHRLAKHKRININYEKNNKSNWNYVDSKTKIIEWLDQSKKKLNNLLLTV